MQLFKGPLNSANVKTIEYYILEYLLICRCRWWCCSFWCDYSYK